MTTILLLALLPVLDELAIRRVVEQLSQDMPRIIRIRTVGRPTVVISHEPWGEARIHWPGVPSFDVVTSRVEARSVRFLAPDLALVDAVVDYDSQLTPLLILVKKEAGEWKIDTLRALARRQPVLQ